MLKLHSGFLFSFISTLVLIITGCELPPVETPVPMQTPCTQATLIPLSFRDFEDTTYFVLIENSSQYRNLRFTESSLEIISNLLGGELNDGDRVIAATLDQHALNSQMSELIYFDHIFRAHSSQSPPTLIPSIEPVSSPTVISTPITQLGQAQLARTQTAFDIRVTQTHESYDCDVYKANEERSSFATQIAQEHYSNAREFVTELITEVNPILNIPEDDGENLPILEALTSVSEFLSEDCADIRGRNCILLIFSNMSDYRSNYAEAMPLSSPHPRLDNITTVTVLFGCEYEEGSCGMNIENWTRHLSTYGALDIEFILNVPTGDMVASIQNILEAKRNSM